LLRFFEILGAKKIKIAAHSIITKLSALLLSIIF